MKYTLKTIHEKDLILFKEFLKICKKNKLEYYAIGGTFLGAIRHKGFIPWDDDMDIAMPREDFNKFVEIANKELPKNIKLITFENDKDYRYYIPRLIDLNAKINEVNSKKEENIFIDIFPIDGTPNNSILRKVYYFRVLLNRMLISYYYSDEINSNRKRKLYEKVLIVIGKILPTKLLINPKKRLKKIDKLLRNNNYNNSKYVGTIMGAYRTREIVPKHYFGKPTKYDFEGLKIYGPEKYDEYLHHMYGDYMKIPENKNENQHLDYQK